MKMDSLLKSLVQFKTVTSDTAMNKKALLWCKDFLKAKGISSKIEFVEGHHILWWGSNPVSAEIMINSHIDVVPGTDVTFTPKLSGNFFFGRGSMDTKSSVSVMLSMDRDVVKTATQKKATFVLVSDEEIGGKSSRKFIESLPKLKWALFLEPTGLKIINQAKGIMQVKIMAEGKAVHGSRPWAGINAIELINKGLSNFLKSNPTPTKESQSTTFNFSVISGGSAINQTPNKCELLIDVRYNPKDKPAQIISLLRKKFTKCKIEEIITESPINSPKDNVYTVKMLKAIKESKIKPEFAFDHASSDARHCTKINIPAIIFGPSGDGMHQDVEKVDLRSVEKVKNIVAFFIKNF